MKAKTKTNRAEPKAKRTTKTVKTVAPKPTKKTETVLVLRTCTAEMRGIVPSSSEFVWPERGPVQCKDWNPEPICGGGLHGLLWGEGEGINLLWQAGAKWLVVEVAAKDIVDLGGKVKFPRGVVVFCGDQAGATAYLAAHGGAARTIVGGTATAGYRGTATAGEDGVLSILWWDGERNKYRRIIGTIGEEGLEPKVAYRVNDAGKFEPATKP